MKAKTKAKTKTHQGVRVLEKEEPLEALPLQLLGHPFPQEEVVNVAVAVGLRLERERVVRGEYQARRAVSEGGDLATKEARKAERKDIRKEDSSGDGVFVRRVIATEKEHGKPGATVFRRECQARDL